MELFGHKKIFEALTDTPEFSSGKSYCFVGPKQIGKMHTAVCVAEKVLPHTPRKEIFRHPDLMIIRREKNKKTDKTKKNIDLSQIQQVQQFISRNSALNGMRIVIIEDAQLCHEQAQQALLKTIEELPKQVLVIFLIPEKEVLLPTIISRCHIVHFAALNKKQMQDFATYIGCSDTAMIEAAQGRPGKLKQWNEHPDKYLTYTVHKQEFLALFGKSFSEKIQAIEQLFGTKEDHIATRAQLIDRLDCWLEATREKMQVESNPKNMVKLVQTIADTRFKLLQNIHPRLLVEKILLEIPE